MSNNASQELVKAVYGKTLDATGRPDMNFAAVDFEPFEHHVLVDPIPPDAVTTGGLAIPTKAQEEKFIARVVAVNAKDKGGPFDVGDYVFYRPGSGTKLNMGGKEYLVLQYHSREEGEIVGRWRASSVDKGKA